MESPAAQQLDAQRASEDVGTASDASEPSEDFMQAEALQPLSVHAAKEGSDEEGDALDIAPAGSSGAVVQEARSDEALPYPGDTHAQGMLDPKCLVLCMSMVFSLLVSLLWNLQLTDPRHAHMHAFALVNRVLLRVIMSSGCMHSEYSLTFYVRASGLLQQSGIINLSAG